MKIDLKFIFGIIGILTFDIILMWLCVFQMDPDPSVSIGVIILVPLVFTINLLLAGIFYLFKKRRYIRIFLFNSILCSVVTYYLFNQGISRHQRNELEMWEFKKADTTFSLIRWKKTNEFNMTYSTMQGSSTQFLVGTYRSKNGEFILKTDSTKYIIKENCLIGFKRATGTIRLKKVEL